MDFGFPQIVEPDLLKLYITQGGLKRNLEDPEALKKTLTQATGAISWRNENIRYRKNEVYIDVIENVNVLVSTTGTILRSDVSGIIQVKALLSFMPECKFGMNDKLVMSSERRSRPSRDAGIQIDDVKFH